MTGLLSIAGILMSLCFGSCSILNWNTVLGDLEPSLVVVFCVTVQSEEEEVGSLVALIAADLKYKKSKVNLKIYSKCNIVLFKSNWIWIQLKISSQQTLFLATCHLGAVFWLQTFHDLYGSHFHGKIYEPVKTLGII